MRAAPPASDPILQIGGAGPSVDVDLRATTTEFVEHTHDFHCVTTWTYRDVIWGGFALRDVLVDDCGLDIADLPPFAKAAAGDGRHAVFRSDDLLEPSVLVATQLQGEPLPRRHGAPLRLITPNQYGYKNVKHLTRIEFAATQPESSFGKKEHLRARVALEERHPTLPNWALRVPYRLTVVPTALAAEKGLRKSS